MPPKRSMCSTTNCRSCCIRKTRCNRERRRIWDEVPDNMIVETFFGDKEATDRAFADAAHVIKKKFVIGRVTGVPMEPRSAVAQYYPETDSYILYAGSGGAVRQQNELIKVVGVPPEQAARDLRRCRRQFRHAQSHLCRIRSGAVGGEAARTSGEIYRDTIGSFPQRLSGPRPGDVGRACARRETSLHRHARHQHQQCRLPVRVAVASQQGLGTYSRLVSHSGNGVALDRCFHQHHADQCLPQLGPSGSDVRCRAAC